jgi:hypothetical protein
MSGLLTIKWSDGELDIEDVKSWVEDNKALATAEIDTGRIANLLYDFYLESQGRRGLGHFLRAVKENDFRKAVAHADSGCRRAIALFQLFLDNVAPASYTN